MGELTFEKWVISTYENCIDPSTHIYKEEEEKQRCVICGDYNECGCKEKWSNKSNCCEAKMDTDLKICYGCGEHCESAWEYDNKLINK